jgi:hypothetical protein
VTAASDRTRWAALVVLCVGMLTVMRPPRETAAQQVEGEPAEAAA